MGYHCAAGHCLCAGNWLCGAVYPAFRLLCAAFTAESCPSALAVLHLISKACLLTPLCIIPYASQSHSGCALYFCIFKFHHNSMARTGVEDLPWSMHSVPQHSAEQCQMRSLSGPKPVFVASQMVLCGASSERGGRPPVLGAQLSQQPHPGAGLLPPGKSALVACIPSERKGGVRCIDATQMEPPRAGVK